MAVVMVAISLVLGALWGAFWAHVRDQDRIPGLPGFTKAKELGLVVFGLPLALLWLATCNHSLQVGLIGAGIIWAGMAGAWSMGHLGGMGLRFAPSRKGMSVPACYAAMALTGALVTLAPRPVCWRGRDRGSWPASCCWRGRSRPAATRLASSSAA